QIPLVRHPSVASPVIEPTAGAGGTNRTELAEQVIAGPQPTDERVSFLAVIDTRRPQPALDGGGDPVAEFFTGAAMDNGFGSKTETEFHFDPLDKLLRH